MLTAIAENVGKIPVSRVFCPGNRNLSEAGLFVEGRIGEVNVLLIHALLGQGDGLTEVINLSKAIFKNTTHKLDIQTAVFSK